MLLLCVTEPRLLRSTETADREDGGFVRMNSTLTNKLMEHGYYANAYK